MLAAERAKREVPWAWRTNPWRTTEDEQAGVIKYGVANYEPRKSVAKITAPTRPALPAPVEPPQDGSLLLLM